MLPAILIPIAIQLGVRLIDAAIRRYETLPVPKKERVVRNKKVRAVLNKVKGQ